MGDVPYVGNELELFADAHHWKAYWRDQIAPFVTGEVAEVGAGIGSNMRLFEQHAIDGWLCIEPDAQLAARVAARLPASGRVQWSAVHGTLDVVRSRQFDTIIYIDVLEHIEDDAGELRRATDRLRPGGRLIVVAPAHGWLWSPLDAAVGHARRYTRASLRRIAPPPLREERMRYLDSVGVLAAAANALALRQTIPTRRQLALWDGWMVPASRWLDRPLAYSVGKSVLAIWRRRD